MSARLKPALLLILISAGAWPASTAEPAFILNDRYLSLPEGASVIGDSHGDIAVSPAGDIYVSVEGGERAGLQVYSAEGRYLRNVPNAPVDLHGFVIATPSGQRPSIYGASLRGERIIQLSLEGEVLLSIPAAAIPDEYKMRRDDRLVLALTGVAVSAGGDIYAVDGYGRDFIHRFDRTGRYQTTFGGKEEPWGFNTCHKIAIDTRFDPARLLCADRARGRLVHMDLDGRVLGTFAAGLRSPSALAVFQDDLAVAELEGRLTILDLQGQIRATLGVNPNTGEIRTNKIAPEQWRSDCFYAPHGVAYARNGELLVAEWSKWGRVVHVKRALQTLPRAHEALHAGCADSKP